MNHNLKLKVIINVNKMNKRSALFLQDRHEMYFGMLLDHFKSTFLISGVSYDIGENGYIITIQKMSNELSAIQSVTDYFMGILPSSRDCVSWTESISMPEGGDEKALLIASLVSSHENIKNLNTIFGNFRYLKDVDVMCLAALARTSGHFEHKDITSGKINMSSGRKAATTMSSESIILDNEDYYCRILNYPSHEPTDSSNILLVEPEFDLYIEDKSDKGRRSATEGKYGGYVYRVSLSSLMSPKGRQMAKDHYMKEVFMPATENSGNYPFIIVGANGDHMMKDAAVGGVISAETDDRRRNTRSHFSNIIKRR